MSPLLTTVPVCIVPEAQPISDCNNHCSISDCNNHHGEDIGVDGAGDDNHDYDNDNDDDHI